jgi:hypothetical protein
MNVMRDLAALCAVGLIMAGATVRASAQADLDADADITPYAASLTPQAEQRSLAQLGLGQAFMWRLLQSQLNILDEENKHESGAGPCKNLSDGGTIKLKSKVGTFASKAVVEIYYDSNCKDVFIHSEMTINEENSKSVSVSEKATYKDEDGKTVGTLALKAGGAKKSSLVSFAGSGTWTPGSGTWTPSKGAKVQIALSCSYPETLKNAKPFNCNFGMAQSFKNLKRDLATVGQIRVTVVPIKKLYNGEFTGKAQIFSGALGKLGVSLPKGGPVAISGSKQFAADAKIKGINRLTVFWPPPNAWTVDDGQQKATVAMMPGTTRDSNGIITNTTPPTPATFLIDKSGNGQITYTDSKKSTVLNWLVSE